MPPPTEEGQHPTALFSTVLADFCVSLPETEQSSFCQYASSSDMLREIEAQSKLHKQSDRLYKCTSKIADFSKAFDPFFEVINVFVQVKPEWLGVFWGSIRLIFKLGSNHVELLEKIADHLETLTWTLPQYERHLERAQRMQHTIVSDRLIRLMSYVYADVIRFVQRIHSMLARGRKDAPLRDRLAFLTGSFWKPFDTRFADLVNNMKKHESLFEKELYVEDQEELMYNFREFDKHLRKHENLPTRERLRVEREDSELAASQILKVREWLGYNDYQRPFERASRLRHKDTGKWLFQQPDFKQWRDDAFEGPAAPDRSWSDGILSLQAKPGYGKTVLSAGIIDHLRSQLPATLSNRATQPCTAFFHFEKDDPMRVRPADAIKSIASQLIYMYRNDRGLCDGLTLLTETQMSGQARASDEDAEKVVQFLLDRYPCYIVLDAIDECAEPRLLLDQIGHLCDQADSRFIILSRPELDLPWRYRKVGSQFRALKLSGSHNLPDIGRFLNDEFGKAIELGLFGEHSEHDLDGREIGYGGPTGEAVGSGDPVLSPDSLYEYFSRPSSPIEDHDSRSSPTADTPILESTKHNDNYAKCSTAIRQLACGQMTSEKPDLQSICHKIAIQSDGMFLWARLLINYLNSPALTPYDRFEAIAGVRLLEGIDTLYLDILKKVVHKFEKEKEIAVNIFRWLTFGLYTLSIDSLHTAITLQLGKPSSWERKVVDFARSLGRITCALVETNDRGAPRMIHTSFKDFLRTPNRELESYGFSLRHAEREHCRIGNSCLSYLIHDIPRAPLHSLELESRYDLDLECREAERVRRPTASSAQSLAKRRRGLLSKYPLLSYATLSWGEHLVRTRPRDLSTEWLSVLSEFLLDRIKVTVWVEACWTLRWTPSVARLTETAQPLAEACFTSFPILPEKRELIWTVHGLKTLGHALDGLRLCSVALGEEPVKIWLL